MSADTQLVGRTRRSMGPDAQRTARALLAVALGAVPLVELFTDARWLFDVWLAMAIVIIPGLLLRLVQHPHVWHDWLGLVLLVPWLTARFVPDHAWLNIIPTTATWQDIDALMGDVRETTSNGVAPVDAGPAIKLLLALVFGLLAAFVDLIAVVGRRAALAGVPLLVIYTVAGAVRRHPVGWFLFAVAAVGFLLLLSLDAKETVREWGRLIPRQGDHRPTAALGVSGPRIAVLAVTVAVLVPLVAPSRPSNLIADALHNSNGSGAGNGNGIGPSGRVSLNPFSALKGDLKLTKPVNLFTVTVDSATETNPYYLRANVLTNYSDQGWSVGSHGGKESILSTFFGSEPATSPDLTTEHFSALIKISGLNDNAPVFLRPSSVGDLDRDSTWSRTDQLLLGPRVHRGQEIVEVVDQPAPTAAQLAAAPDPDRQEVQAWTAVPASMPPSVRNLVGQITAGQTTAYGKARALSDYFTNPANGFTYSLETKAGDSGSDLVDFLTNKAGYCQQYAAAMGIMLRLAGLPSRVVLGYTHGSPDTNGTFTVTTTNAHAWVEVYFNGLGWIPFDPTPIAGSLGGATLNLPWAPHRETAGADRAEPSASKNASNNAASSAGPSAAPLPSTSHGAGFRFTWPWLVAVGAIVLIFVLLLTPSAVRSRRRRRRLHAARRGDPDPLWSELSDTAIDLGYVWSPARSPRQVVSWLSKEMGGGEPVASLQTLARAVETTRYAERADVNDDHLLTGDLRAVEARLRRRRSAATRIRSRLLPASLGWRLRLPPRRR